MRLSPIGAGFYSANRTIFRGAETKPQGASSSSLTQEAKKDPKKVMEQLLAREGNKGKKLAAFDFYSAWHKSMFGGYQSFDTYSVESVEYEKRDDIAGAVFELVVNSDLSREDKFNLLKTIVSEDIICEGQTKEGLYSSKTGYTKYKSMLNLHDYFKGKGKDLDEVAKELGATEKLSPNEKFAANNASLSSSNWAVYC